jgi:nucleotide-binding universal stress UspA family protein
MYQRILVPVDGSRTSQRGLGEAIALARVTGGRLLLLHVVDELAFSMSVDGFSGFTSDLLSLLRESGEQLLAKARAQVEAAGLPAETLMLDSFRGRVCDLVVEQAKSWAAELIVIGTHGRRGASRLLLGSDAEQVLRLAPVPVLLVRAPDDDPAADTAPTA